MPARSVASAIYPPKASISLARCVFPIPPIAGLQDILPDLFLSKVIKATFKPKRFPTKVASTPAGVEATLVGKRFGLNVALITLDKNKSGRMSCNPAIGGIGKTHLAKEIDALGGYMAEATDLAGIQFKTLNKKKGPAVQATRAQTDKEIYEKTIQNKLTKEGITVIEDEIKDFLFEKGQILSAVGVKEDYKAKAYVLTTGTFLNGSILIGDNKQEGGRIDEDKSAGLEKFFTNLNITTGRLKTGTPPRLSSKTINYDKLETQPGDEKETYMSYLGQKNRHPKQVSCHITKTNPTTHKIIENNIKRSADLFMLFSIILCVVGFVFVMWHETCFGCRFFCPKYDM